MPTPDFVLRLRESIGHDLLPMSGVLMVVVDGQGRVLLNRRSDTGRWALLGGIIEPGEEPAVTAVREVFEETGVHVVPERLISVRALPRSRYPNGDQVQFLELAFQCRLVGGTARVNDDESLEVGWFTPDELPPLSEKTRSLVARALRRDEVAAWFVRPDPLDLGGSPEQAGPGRAAEAELG